MEGEYKRRRTLNHHSSVRGRHEKEQSAGRQEQDGALIETVTHQAPENDANELPEEKLDGGYLTPRGKREGRPWEDDQPAQVSVEARRYMRERAEELREQLDKGTPSFAKVLTRSDALGRSGLRFPDTFCKQHMPGKNVYVGLNVRNNCQTYSATFVLEKKGLSVGWRRFASDHGLHDGDALVFHLLKPNSFKVYILRSDDFVAAEASASIKAASSGSKYRAGKVHRMLIDNIIAGARDHARSSPSRISGSTLRRSLNFSD